MDKNARCQRKKKESEMTLKFFDVSAKRMDLPFTKTGKTG